MFFYNSTLTLSFANFDELKGKCIEIYLYEVDKSKYKTQLNTLDIKGLEELMNKSLFYSGIKIDLLSIVFGPEHYDLPLMKIDSITSKHINVGRIIFKLKSNELCSYRIILSNLLISSPSFNTNKELNAMIQMEFKDIPSYQSNSCSIYLGKQSENSIELMTDIMSIEDLYKGILNISIYNNSHLICHCSLSEYKDDLMFNLYDCIINSKDDNRIAYNNIPIILNEKDKGDLSFELSIDTEFNVLQMKNKTLSENGVCSSATYLYANFNQCSSPTKIDDSFLSIHHMIEVSLNNLKDINAQTENKSNIANKYIEKVREEIGKTFHSDMFIYQYEEKCELKKMQSTLLKLGKEIIRLIEIFIDDNDFTVLLFDTLRMIIQREEIKCELLTDMLVSNKEMMSDFINFYKAFLSLGNIINGKIGDTKCFHLNDIYCIMFFRCQHIKEIICKELIVKSNGPMTEIIPLYHIEYDDKMTSLINSNDIIKNTNVLFPNLSAHGSFYLSFIKNIVSYYKDNYSFPFTPSSFDIIPTLLRSFITLLSSSSFNSLYSYYINEIISLLLNESRLLTQIINTILINTNAYDSSSVFATLDLIHNVLSKGDSKVKVNYYILQMAENAIFALENGQNITKMIWLYYCDAHLMDSSHVKWFIGNIVNNKIFYFAFHWSWKVRMMFYKTVMYIFKHRIKEIWDKTKIKDIDILDKEDRKEIEKKVKELSIKTADIETSLNEYRAVKREVASWLETNSKKSYIEYPIILITFPKEDDCSKY